MSKPKDRFQQVGIRYITADQDLQSRVATDLDVVKDYSDAIVAGAVFPPVTIFDDGNIKWLADGFHRLDAHRRAGLTSIAAEVREGTREDAILHSVGANLKMGIHPTREDRRKAVVMLLKEERFFTLGNKPIAERCGVHSSTVNAIRKEFCLERGIPVPEELTCLRKDGTVQRRRSNGKALREPQLIRAKRDNQHYLYVGWHGKRSYLGPDTPETREKFEARKVKLLDARESKEDARLSMSRPPKLVSWLMVRGVRARCFSDHSSWSFPGVVVDDAMFCVPAPRFVAESIFWAVGMALMYREQEGSTHGLAVVCYPGHDAARPLIATASALGVEFVTPEELVARFAPVASLAGANRERESSRRESLWVKDDGRDAREDRP